MTTRDPQHANALVYDHPLVQHKLSRLRDRETKHADFRRLLNELAGLMAYEVCRNLPTTDVMIETPVAQAKGKVLATPVTIVPILRAGLGMTDGLLALFPEARVGHIGIYRDEETAKPVTYYSKLPDGVADGPVILVDPMLATGGSSAHAVDILQARGVRNIQLVCLVAAPEGLAHMRANHPEVTVHTAAIDERLNERCYIVPGLGDAGDRIYGTH